MKPALDIFHLAGALQLTDSHPCFGIAVFRKQDQEGFWAQVIKPGNQRVAAFVVVSSDDAMDVQEYIVAREVKIGDEFVHAFIDHNGGLHLDTADNLRVYFNIALASRRASSAVKLTIREQMGDSNGGVEARTHLIATVAEAFGGSVGRTFQDSIARGKLWELLEAAATSPQALTRIKWLRPKLLAHITPEGVVELKIDELEPSDVHLTKQELEQRIAGDFARFVSTGRLPSVDLKDIQGLLDPTDQTILQAVGLSPRQEERLAVLIRSLLLHPDPAKRALEKYRDAAEYARSAIETLQQVVGTVPKGADERIREQRMAEIIPRLISDAYPRRRGKIVYYLAEHLADFPMIVSALRTFLARTRSFEVEVLRADIELALSEGTRASRSRS